MEAIRQRKMQALQEQAQQEAQMQQQVAQLETIVKTLFTKEALSRYGNLKAAHPEKAVQVLAAIGQMMQQGKAQKITDEDLKKILTLLTPKTKQIKIRPSIIPTKITSFYYFNPVHVGRGWIINL